MRNYDVVVAGTATIVRVRDPPPPSLNTGQTFNAMGSLEADGVGIPDMYIVLEVNGRAKYLTKTDLEGGWSFMDCLLPFGIPHEQEWRGTTNTVKVIFEGTADYAPSESSPYDVTMLMPSANYETDFITLDAGYYIELGFQAFGPKHLSITLQKEDPAGPDGELIYPAFPDAVAEDEWWWGWFALSNVGTVTGNFKVSIQEV